MKDPLNSFDWQSLHSRYDAKCRGFYNGSRYLAAFETCRPATDRALYYELIRVFAEDRGILITSPLEIYEALLYWKLYSQPAAISNTVRSLREDARLRKDTQERVLALFQKLPAQLEKSTAAVLDIVEQLGSFRIHGIKTSTALPVRTTLLHFMYPSVVPIFDKMVLHAVGIWDEHANQSTKFLKAYLPFAWELADRYAQNFSRFEKESPIRVIDMALWVGRGEESTSNRLVQNGHENTNRKAEPSMPLPGSAPRKGDVFKGKIYDLSLWDTDGWKRRDIRYFKHEVNRHESFAYPMPGNKITLIDTDGDRYELKFSKPDLKETICLGTPSKLKSWYEKKGFDSQAVNPADSIYFKYSGVEFEFHILTEQEYAAGGQNPP